MQFDLKTKEIHYCLQFFILFIPANAWLSHSWVCITFLIWIVQLLNLLLPIVFTLVISFSERLKSPLAPDIFFSWRSLYTLIKSLFNLLLISYAYWTLTGKHFLYSSEYFVVMYVIIFSLWKNVAYTVETSKKLFHLRNCVKLSSVFLFHCPEFF